MLPIPFVQYLQLYLHNRVSCILKARRNADHPGSTRAEAQESDFYYPQPRLSSNFLVLFPAAAGNYLELAKNDGRSGDTPST